MNQEREEAAGSARAGHARGVDERCAMTGIDNIKEQFERRCGRTEPTRE